MPSSSLSNYTNNAGAYGQYSNNGSRYYSGLNKRRPNNRKKSKKNQSQMSTKAPERNESSVRRDANPLDAPNAKANASSSKLRQRALSGTYTALGKDLW
jgi:hypothetical protein